MVFYLPSHVYLNKIFKVGYFFPPSLAGWFFFFVICLFFAYSSVLAEAYTWVKSMTVGRNLDNMNSKQRSCHVHRLKIKYSN